MRAYEYTYATEINGSRDHNFVLVRIMATADLPCISARLVTFAGQNRIRLTNVWRSTADELVASRI